MRLPLRRVVVWLLLAGCGDDAGTNAPDAPGIDGLVDSGTDALTLGPPISAPNDMWTWVDFPDSTCGDGTPTGIGINPTAASRNVLILMGGGGLCWNYLNCYVFNTAVQGPYGSAQFAAQQGSFAGTILDRTIAGNPFHDWNLVYVPYCTGDLHAGDAVTTYTSGSMSRMFSHRGSANIVAYLRRLVPTFSAPIQIAVVGLSTGGGGALIDHPTFRAFWPTGRMYVIDDSFPLLEGDAIPGVFRSAWYANWNLAEQLDPLCGTPCQSDLSIASRSLAQRFPNDRFALLSSEQDQTMSSLVMATASEYQSGLLQMSRDVLDPTTNFRYFFVTGSTHTMLGSPANVTGLLPWLTEMVTDDPSWMSVQP